MSRLSVPVRPQPSAGHAWFMHHYPEISLRARYFTRRLPARDREDGQAEIVAMSFAYVLGAARRGKLAWLTPAKLVRFYVRAYRAGRRLAGTRTCDAFPTRYCGRAPVQSLDQPCRVRGRDGEQVLSLADRPVRPPGP